MIWKLLFLRFYLFLFYYFAWKYACELRVSGVCKGLEKGTGSSGAEVMDGCDHHVSAGDWTWVL